MFKKAIGAMSSKIRITDENAADYFFMRRLSAGCDVNVFDCAISEYNLYLQRDALQSQKDLVALTWVLCEHKDEKVVAYMSLIADAIKLSLAEKELHNLNYPFMTLPAMKIAKLAVSKTAKEKYSGIGTKMLDMATAFANSANKTHFACRFVTVDADIENDAGVTAFYTKNGFISNAEMNKKSNKTINMRRDLFL
jgi:ribosomal protein S18 acetylase RimI-like enzyme